MSAKLIQLMTVCGIALPIWLFLRRPWKRRPLTREIVMGLFAVFMAGVLTLALEGQWTAPGTMLERALSRVRTGRRINMQPLRTIGRQMRSLYLDESVTQLLGNTLLFMPWGFCLPLLWRRFRHPLVLPGMCLLLTCMIEGTQLFIERMVDVDDLILNFAGSMAGAGLWCFVHAVCPGMDDALAVK